MTLEQRARRVLEAARAAGLTLSTAESCTGGMVAAALTAVPGSSDVFEAGYVTYSNTAKTRMLNVPVAVLEEFGAVSTKTALAMARGAAPTRGLAVSITGIAGPGGGSALKPVGLVEIAIAGISSETRTFRWGDIEPHADRARIRHLSAEAALELLEDHARRASPSL